MLSVEYFPEDEEYYGNPDAFRAMFQRAGAWYTGEDTDPYAMFFVVKTYASAKESNALRCMTEAMLCMMSRYGWDESVAERMDAWCGSRIRKVVKRAHGSKWNKLLDGLEEIDIPSICVSDLESGASVVAFAPMRMSEQPKTLKNLQVSGLMLEEEAQGEELFSGLLEVIVDDCLELSSGKMMAQAGHALQLAIRYMPDDAYRIWQNAGYPIYAHRGQIKDGAEYDAVVTDAGFTEIAPGTRTAVARIILE